MNTANMGLYRLVAIVLIGLLATAARADSWALPETKQYLSDDGRWRFTVTPRELAGQLQYFEDKVANRENAGARPGDTRTHASARMERREREQWSTVWTGPLTNEVAPVAAIVSSTGQATTFDNWHTVGWGDNVVVIYDTRGQVVRSMGLKDFLPADYVKALPRSVSSVWWGRDHRYSSDGTRLLLRVVVPSEQEQLSGDAQYVELAFDATTGQALPPSEPQWAAALAAAKRVAAAMRVREAEEEAKFLAPLLGPSGADGDGWRDYLRDAYWRVTEGEGEDYPRVYVLKSPNEPGYSQSVAALQRALLDPPDPKQTIMLASAQQADLVRVLSETAARMPASRALGARLYVAADDAHSAAIAAALAPTGWRYVQLDPSEPIAQSESRLRRYREMKQAEASEAR